MKKEYVNPQMYCTWLQAQTIVCASGNTGGDPSTAQLPSHRDMAGDAVLI